MHVAVRVGVQEIVEFLADHGADVNSKDREGKFQFTMDTPNKRALYFQCFFTNSLLIGLLNNKD